MDKRDVDGSIERKNVYKNEKGIIIVFLPIILFSILFISVDSYSEYENFGDAFEYFKKLYSNRLLIFAFIVLGWKHAKKIVSGYILLLITYLFNILIVLSDIFNVNRFIEEYKENNEAVFYKNLFLKNAFNYFFLISWTGILSYNLLQWYRVYKLSQRIEVAQDEHDKNN